MIWDFVSRRPLPVRDYVVSIKGRPKMWNHVSKVWRLLVWWNKTDEKLDMKISFFVIILPNMNSPNFSQVIWQLGTIPDRNNTVPDRLWSAAHEILKIIESPPVYTLRSGRIQSKLTKKKIIRNLRVWLSLLLKRILSFSILSQIQEKQFNSNGMSFWVRINPLSG